MDPRVKRLLITIIVLCASIAILAVVFTARPPKPTTPAQQPAPAQTADADTAADETAADNTGTETTAVDTDTTTETDTAADTETAAANPPKPTDSIHGSDQPTAADSDTPTTADHDYDLTTLTARAPIARDASVSALDTIGSLDPAAHRYQVELTSRGAAVSRIVSSDIWTHVKFRQQAEAHEKAVANGETNPPPMPPDSERLVLVDTERINRGEGAENDPQPVLAMHSLLVNNQAVDLFDYRTADDGTLIPIWSLTAPGRYETEITDANGKPVLRVVRQWTLKEQSYDLTLTQHVENLSNEQLTVQWRQYGPPQLEPTGAPYIDPRRFRVGYMLSKQVDPKRLAEVNAGTDMMVALSSAQKHIEQASQLSNQMASNPRSTPEQIAAYDEMRTEYNDLITQWPNAKARRENYELSWFASTNRYFALAIHPAYSGSGPVNRSLQDTVADVKQQLFASSTAKNGTFISTFISSPTHTLAPNGSTDFSLGVYSGPMDRSVLNETEPYRTLNLGGLIVYQMSSFCAFCTFQWLAHILIWFLTAAHSVVLDWGFAIILLVLTVRLMLHPITKRAQVSMHRTMKAMGKFKPELEKLQKKYANDKKKLQEEQFKLMREHGVNPLGCLGILPMLLQTPIWIALYAMLFFAYELRQEHAFWGFFQLFGNWGFLADLSQADHFLGEFSQPVHPLGFLGVTFFSITGLNILPVIMGVVFFIQQKYMSPQAAATMSKEQQQQQKIMRFMMIFLFPVMLYNAPSGLTLYIMTSSTVGIIESRRIRKHAEELEALREADPNRRMDAPPWGERDKKKKPRDPRGRAYADMLERMRQNKKEQQSFKKRKKDK